MLKKFLHSLTFALVVFPDFASASPWNLPLDLNDQNTKVQFEVDSTWHLVKGSTKGINGRLQLADEKNPQSLTGEVKIPVALFDTDSSRRDNRMREVMEAEKYSNVSFRIQSAKQDCGPEQSPQEVRCNVHINGKLEIHGISRDWPLLGILRREGEKYTFQADGDLMWADFGIEDPSILVAKLNPKVSIHISTTWKAEDPK